MYINIYTGIQKDLILVAHRIMKSCYKNVHSKNSRLFMIDISNVGNLVIL